MKEIIGDLWDYLIDDNFIVIPTNGDINQKNLAVMGRGLAKQAVDRYGETISRRLGKNLKVWGNNVTYISNHIISFPVKHHWQDDADITLIRKSCEQLGDFVNLLGCKKVYLPRVGCGKGRLEWSDVQPVLSELLDDRFVVVSLEGASTNLYTVVEDVGIEL